MKKILICLSILFSSCTTQVVNNTPSTQPTKTPEPVKTIAPTPALPTPVPTPSALVFDINQEYKVNMETSLGTIKLKLFNKEAPKAVENFVRLIDKKFYDGLTFHRIMPNFMIQGGDPTGTGFGGESIYGKEFEDEFTPKLRFDKKGILAMANRGKNTNTSQFFITVDSYRYPFSGLNDVHTIFGEVTEGLDVIEKIVNSPRDSKDKPLEKISMTKVTLY